MFDAIFAEPAPLVHFSPTNSGSSSAYSPDLKTAPKKGLPLVEINIDHHLSHIAQRWTEGVLQTNRSV